MERDVVFGKVPSHGIGAALAEHAVFRLRAVRRRVTGHLNEVALFGLGLRSDFVESRFGFIRKHGAVDLEVHSDVLLGFVVVDLRDAVVGGLDVGGVGLGGGERLVGGLLGGFGPATRSVGDGGQFFELARQTLSVLLGGGHPVLSRVHATFGGGHTRFDGGDARVERTRYAEIVVGEFDLIGDQYA